jgi:hypothetical protein
VVDGQTGADDSDVGFDDAPDCGGDGAACIVSVLRVLDEQDLLVGSFILPLADSARVVVRMMLVMQTLFR